jgi:hypothetical protein
MNNQAGDPHNRTLRKPLWYTAKLMIPRANNQTISVPRATDVIAIHIAQIIARLRHIHRLWHWQNIVRLILKISSHSHALFESHGLRCTTGESKKRQDDNGFHKVSLWEDSNTVAPLYGYCIT